MTIKQQGQAAGLFGAVALFSALFCWLFIAGRFSHPAVWVQLVLGVVAVAAYLVTNLDSLGTQLAGRGTFYGVISAATALIVVLAVVVGCARTEQTKAVANVDPSLVRLSGAIDDHRAPRPVTDAISALVNLGYGAPQAAAAIASASRSAGENAETAQLIRLGLKELAK